MPKKLFFFDLELKVFFIGKNVFLDGLSSKSSTLKTLNPKTLNPKSPKP